MSSNSSLSLCLSATRALLPLCRACSLPRPTVFAPIGLPIRERRDVSLSSRASMMNAAVQDGELIDTGIVIELLADVIKRESYQHPGVTCILDNFPISSTQLDRYELGHHNGLKMPHIARVIVLEAKEETMVHRMMYDPSSPHKKMADDRRSSQRNLNPDAGEPAAALAAKAAAPRAATSAGDYHDDGEEGMRASISRWKKPFDLLFAQFKSMQTPTRGGGDGDDGTATAAESASSTTPAGKSNLVGGGSVKILQVDTEGLDPEAVLRKVEPFFLQHLTDVRNRQSFSSLKTLDRFSSEASLEEQANQS